MKFFLIVSYILLTSTSALYADESKCLINIDSLRGFVNATYEQDQMRRNDEVLEIITKKGYVPAISRINTVKDAKTFHQNIYFVGDALYERGIEHYEIKYKDNWTKKLYGSFNEATLELWQNDPSFKVNDRKYGIKIFKDSSSNQSFYTHGFYYSRITTKVKNQDQEADFNEIKMELINNLPVSSCVEGYSVDD